MSSMLTFMKTEHQKKINNSAIIIIGFLGVNLEPQGRNQPKRGQIINVQKENTKSQLISSMLTFMKTDHQKNIIFSAIIIIRFLGVNLEPKEGINPKEVRF